MKKLLILFCFWPAFAQAQIPGYDIRWGMAQRDVHTALPSETHTGTMQYYMIPFAGFPSESHPVQAGMYYRDEYGLRYVEFRPFYEYQQAEDWNGDFNHINEFMLNEYGDPYDKTPGRRTWVTPETVGRFMWYEGDGWTVRFDSREDE